MQLVQNIAHCFQPSSLPAWFYYYRRKILKITDEYTDRRLFPFFRAFWPIPTHRSLSPQSLSSASSSHHASQYRVRALGLAHLPRSLSGIDSAEAPNMTAFPEGVWA